MKTFKYTIRTQEGDLVSGVVEANSKDEGIAHLRGEHAVVVSIDEVPEGININIGHMHIKDKALALMCNQFAIIMGAGLPIVRTVQLVAGQTTDKTLRKVLLDVASDISAGYGLADSFNSRAGSMFPTTFTETIRAGERSGNLQEVFKRLSTYYETTSRNKGKVVSAMIYPLFVIAVAVVVIIIIMVYAVPMFKSTFAGLGTDLPGITAAMIGMSDFLTNYWAILLAAIAGVILAVYLLKRTSAGGELLSRWGLKLPLFGSINRMTAASQYASTMSIMLGAGISVIDSVDITARALSNRLVSKKLSGILVDLEAGKRLGTCLSRIKEFPELVVEMTAVGEETGSLEGTLGIISEYYDNEVTVATQRALSILEPAIILVLAVFVVMVLLSVYIPLFTMYGSI